MVSAASPLDSHGHSHLSPPLPRTSSSASHLAYQPDSPSNPTRKSDSVLPQCITSTAQQEALSSLFPSLPPPQPPPCNTWQSQVQDVSCSPPALSQAYLRCAPHANTSTTSIRIDSSGSSRHIDTAPQQQQQRPAASLAASSTPTCPSSDPSSPLRGDRCTAEPPLCSPACVNTRATHALPRKPRSSPFLTFPPRQITLYPPVLCVFLAAQVADFVGTLFVPVQDTSSFTEVAWLLLHMVALATLALLAVVIPSVATKVTPIKVAVVASTPVLLKSVGAMIATCGHFMPSPVAGALSRTASVHAGAELVATIVASVAGAAWALHGRQVWRRDEGWSARQCGFELALCLGAWLCPTLFWRPPVWQQAQLLILVCTVATLARVSGSHRSPPLSPRTTALFSCAHIAMVATSATLALLPLFLPPSFPSRGCLVLACRLCAAFLLPGFTALLVHTHQRLVYEHLATMAGAARAELLGRELEELHTMKRQLLLNVSHELNTPLHEVMGCLDALVAARGPDSLPRAARPFAETAQTSVRHAAHLVREMLDAVELQQQPLRLEWAPVNLLELLQQLQLVPWGSVGHDRGPADGSPGPPRQLLLDLSEAEGVAKIPADAEKLTQALYEIISNGFKFSTADVVVRVRAAGGEPRGQVEVAVIDSGCGIPPEAQPTIWLPFQQVPIAQRAVEARQHEGLGLGLYLADQILRAHGTAPLCRSAVGCGTTVSFHLDRCRPSHSDSRNSSPKAECIHPFNPCTPSSNPPNTPISRSTVASCQRPITAEPSSPPPHAQHHSYPTSEAPLDHPSAPLYGHWEYPSRACSDSFNFAAARPGLALRRTSHGSHPSRRCSSVHKRSVSFGACCTCGGHCGAPPVGRHANTHVALNVDAAERVAAWIPALEIGTVLHDHIECLFPSVRTSEALSKPRTSNPWPFPTPSHVSTHSSDSLRISTPHERMKPTRWDVTQLLGSRKTLQSDVTDPTPSGAANSSTDIIMLAEGSGSSNHMECYDAPAVAANLVARSALVASSSLYSSTPHPSLCAADATPRAQSPTLRTVEPAMVLGTSLCEEAVPSHVQAALKRCCHTDSSLSPSTDTNPPISLRGDHPPSIPARQTASMDGVKARTTAPPCIMCVDDNAINQLVISRMLQSAGMNVIKCSSGYEALERLRDPAALPDLLILDVMMPEFSGLELCREVRSMYPDRVLPSIFVSSNSRPENIVDGLEAGAQDYMSKPVNREELVARVQAHLRQKNLMEKAATGLAQELLRNRLSPNKYTSSTSSPQLAI